MVVFSEITCSFLTLIYLKSILGNHVKTPPVKLYGDTSYDLNIIFDSEYNKDYFDNIQASYYNSSDNSKEKGLSADNRTDEPEKPNRDGAEIKKQLKNETIIEDVLNDSECLKKHTVIVNRYTIANITALFQNQNLRRNFSRICITDDYKKLIDMNDFEFLISPKNCNQMSAPWNVENRNVIRKTWANNVGNDTKVLFLFGTTNNITLAKQIKAESKSFGDVIQGNFRDHYRNLTYKHVMGIKWVFHHCKGANFILKTDDDVFINMNYLQLLLKERLSQGTKNFMMCSVVPGPEPVKRDEGHKHTVSKSEYSEEYYPTHCYGGVIVYSADAAFNILKQCQRLPYFWISDTQITGICAQKTGLLPKSLRKFVLRKAEAIKLEQDGPTSVQSFITVPYHLSPDRIQKLWNALHKNTTR